MRCRPLALVLATALAIGAPTLASESLSTSSLRAHTGATAAEAMLGSGSLAVRVRGLERLGALGTPRASVRLVAALAPGGGVATPEERLVAVRALSGFMADPAVRRALSSVLGGHAAQATGLAPHPLDLLSRDTAALVLARSGTTDALSSLGRALSAGGPSADSAAKGLIAHPPRDLSPLVRATEPTVELAAVLERLGGPAERLVLRDLVLRGTTRVRARAAVALCRLGDEETVALGRRWVRAGGPVEERIAGTRILALRRTSDAPAAIIRLLEEESTVEEGISVALEAPSAALVPSLERLLPGGGDPRTARLLSAIGRSGGKSAARILERAIAQKRTAVDAAEALARMPGRDARDALSRALATAGTRRLSLRALTLRWLVLSDAPDGLEARARELTRSSEPWDRAIALAALASRAPSELEELVRSRPLPDLLAVLPLLPIGGAGAATAAARRLSKGPSEPLSWALVGALDRAGVLDEVPTTTLATIVAPGDLRTLPALTALSARDDPGQRPRMLELLADKDPWTRAHVAAGLGLSPEGDATGILASAYRFETDAGARRAIVRALSLRPRDPSRDRALELSRMLDPDEAVRTLSRDALAGARPSAWPSGDQVVWARVPGGGAGPDAGQAVIRAGGLAIPVAPDPDGVVLAAGLPRGPFELRVAPARGTVNDPR